MTIWAWHVHHDTLVEPLRRPIQERRAYIRLSKPAEEIKIRLRLLKLVRGPVPLPLLEAWAAYRKAWAAYRKAGYEKADAAYHKAALEKPWRAYENAAMACDKASVAYEKAWAAYYKALTAYYKAGAACQEDIERLHAEECPNCPWDGKTIFPKPESA